MAGSSVAWGLSGSIGAARVPGRDLIVFVEWAGQISFWDATARVVNRIGSGWLEPEGIVVAADDTTAFVTERGGDVLKVDLRMADRINAETLVSGLDAPHQPVLSADGTVLFVVEFGVSGRLLRIDLASNRIDTIVTGLERAIGLALSPDESTAYITEQANSGSRLIRVDIDTGVISVLLGGLIKPFFMSWADGLPDGHGGTLNVGTHLLLAERDPANRISVINLTMPTLSRRTVDNVGFRPSSTVPLGDRLYVFADREITELDVSTGLEPSVRLRMPSDSLFIGGWARIEVEIGGTGLTFGDLDFEVDGAPITGGISPSRDATFDLARPNVMLLAGSEPGSFAFRAIERTTSTVLAEDKFEVRSEWADELRGAPVQFVGESRWFTTGAAWGGGAAGPFRK